MHDRKKKFKEFERINGIKTGRDENDKRETGKENR